MLRDTESTHNPQEESRGNNEYPRRFNNGYNRRSLPSYVRHSGVPTHYRHDRHKLTWNRQYQRQNMLKTKNRFEPLGRANTTR